MDKKMYYIKEIFFFSLVSFILFLDQEFSW